MTKTLRNYGLTLKKVPIDFTK